MLINDVINQANKEGIGRGEGWALFYFIEAYVIELVQQPSCYILLIGAQIVVGTTGIGLIILILFAWLLKRHWYDMKQITIKKDSEFSILIEQIQVLIIINFRYVFIVNLSIELICNFYIIRLSNKNYLQRNTCVEPNAVAIVS